MPVTDDIQKYFEKVFPRSRFDQSKEVLKVLGEQGVDASIAKELKNKEDFEKRIREFTAYISIIDLEIERLEVEKKLSKNNHAISKPFIIGSGLLNTLQVLPTSIDSTDNKIKIFGVTIHKKGYAKCNEAIEDLEKLRIFFISQITNLSNARTMLSSFEDNILSLHTKLDELGIRLNEKLNKIESDISYIDSMVELNQFNLMKLMLKLDCEPIQDIEQEFPTKG